MLTFKIRSKEPSSEESTLSEYTLKGSPRSFYEASQDFKFASAVAAFGMILRNSPYRGYASFESVLQWAREGKGIDKNGYRDEFIRLVYRASGLSY
jgi:Ca-activated chloride channel family protein